MVEHQGYTWKFREEIIKRSPGAENYEEAIKQWAVIATVKNVTSECICSKKNIKNLNYVINQHTQELAIIGSCCVKKFHVNYHSQSNVNCYVCHKKLSLSNRYVKTLYDSGVVLNKKTKVLGHNKCIDEMKVIYNQLIEKIPDEPTRGSLRSGTLDLVQQLGKYFVGIIDRIDIDENRELVITLSGSQYDKYLQLLNIIST
jgi:hypothetical protein